MKKYIYFLLMLLPLGIMSSCSDDDDLPEVDIIVQLDNVVDQGNRIYVVQGQPLVVTGVSAKGLGGKEALVTGVSYLWDRIEVFYTRVDPFAFSISTSAMPVGNHLLTLNMTLAQVGKPLAYSIMDIPVTVVADAADLPEGSDPGHVSLESRLTPGKK